MALNPGSNWNRLLVLEVIPSVLGSVTSCVSEVLKEKYLERTK